MKYIIGHTKPDLDSTVAPLALKYLFDNVECFGHQNQTKAVLAEPANHETKFVFDKFNAQIPEVLDRVRESDQFILVDHNEKSQRLEGIKDNQIIKIYDHHKLSLDLSLPIFITTKPWGSSNTIIYFLMKQNNLKPSKQIASLMICAILSDTVGLKSPTTTDKDREVLEELNQIAEIKNIDDLTLEIFKAKSDISNLTPIQIVKNDYKIFNFGAHKILVDQIETVEQNKVLGQTSDLLKAMQQVQKEESLDHIFVVISDILKINSKVLYLTDNDKKVLETAFSQVGKNNVIDIGAKLSRKKQIAPALEKALS